MKKINLVIYGATGSIGSSVLSIVRNNKKKFNIQGITCNKNSIKLIKIAKEFGVRKIGICKIKNEIDKELSKFNVFHDINSFNKIVSSNTDIIIFAISGLDGIDLMLKIIKSGKKIGIANKECIISIGNNFSRIAKKYSTKRVPLDSEHNAVYQLLENNNKSIKDITITASGGPFLNLELNKLESISPDQAIKHPKWKMGKKISVDSSNMINKSLELIEAKTLFNLKYDQINAIIHPQSIVHGILNFYDNSSYAFLSQPNMEISISSLFFPKI